MTTSEIKNKIQDLLNSGIGENTYIAVYMMINELGMSMEEALGSLKPIIYDRKKANPNDFYCSIRIANIWVEYDFEEGYVPYMGTESTVARMVGYKNKERMEYVEGLYTFLPLDDSTTITEVHALIFKDYKGLIPTVIELLEQF
jgi:hypothetical protein